MESFRPVPGSSREISRGAFTSAGPPYAPPQQLQQEGYVHEHRMANKSRMSVAPLTKEDAAELYSVIGRLEGLAARNTAVLPKPERMKIVQQLKTLNQQLADVKGDPSKQGQNSRSTAIFIGLSFLLGSAFERLHKAIEPPGRTPMALCQLHHRRSPDLHRRTQRHHSSPGRWRSRPH